MTKSSAFGSVFRMGIRQVETTPVVGTITGAGNATFTMTMAGMTGSPLGISVAVLNADTPDTVATKAVAAMNANVNFAAKCVASCSGNVVTITALGAAANDGTMNLAYTNGTCTGLTPDATSDDAVAGVALTAVAQVSNIGGPGLAADTEDVTTHDSASGFEEAIVTVLRSGEVSLDLVYDPNAATHANTSGLLAKLSNKTPAQYQIAFPGPYNWTFDGKATGFEPSAPMDGVLTATATIKINGLPTLV
jgi:hypothetical protein